MKAIYRFALLSALVAVAILALVACESADNAAAARARAEQAAAEARAAETRAAAEAYEIRQEANSAAAAERAAIRQAEANAAQARALAMLPYVVLIGGGILLALVALLFVWDLRRRSAYPLPCYPALTAPPSYPQLPGPWALSPRYRQLSPGAYRTVTLYPGEERRG